MPVVDCFYFSFWLSLITELTEISHSFLSPGTIVHSTPFRTIGKPILIYISHISLGIWSVSSFFSGFWSKLYPCMSYFPPTTSFLICRLITLGGDWMLWNSVSCNFLHLLLLTVVQIFSWKSSFRTASAYVLPIMWETKPCSNLGQDTDYTDLDFFFFLFFSFLPVKFWRIFFFN